MPIEYITSFSGMNMRMEDLTASSTGSWSNMYVNAATAAGTNAIRRWSEANVLSYNFGVYATGSAISTVGMRFSLIGARFNNNQTYTSAYFTLRVGPRELDATQSAIIGTLKCQPTSYCDFYGGTCIFPYENAELTSGSFRWGYRFRQRNSQTTTYSTIYLARSESTPVQNVVTVQGIVKGADCYIEFEWINTAPSVGTQNYGKFTVYVDDVVMYTVTNPNFDVRFLGWYKECYTQVTQSGNNMTYVDDFEVYDVYFQRILSSADTRPGPLTSVVCAPPISDAGVEFTRPAGYNSNASVASGTLKVSNLGYYTEPSQAGKFLSATAVGQQDMYNVDATAVKARVSTIAAVVVRSWARNTGSGLRGHSSHLAAGGVEATPGFTSSLPANEVNAGYKPSWTLPILVNPATGQRWVPADLDTVTIGAKLDT